MNPHHAPSMADYAALAMSWADPERVVMHNYPVALQAVRFV